MFADKRLTIITVIAAVVSIAIFSLGPIAQNPLYHNFADRRLVSGIPNFYNMISNLPFIVVGAIGLRLAVFERQGRELGGLQGLYVAFFAGVLLTGFGSVYYHCNPNNATLVWDRLPMTIAFMAFFCAIVGDYISPRIAPKLLLPLLLGGIMSVLYWRGTGDLRPYVLVQFLPMLLLPAILWLYQSKFNGGKYLWGVIGAYGLSKLAELFDAGIFNITGMLGGHALKHLLAALGTYIFYCALRERKALGSG